MEHVSEETNDNSGLWLVVGGMVIGAILMVAGWAVWNYQPRHVFTPDATHEVEPVVVSAPSLSKTRVTVPTLRTQWAAQNPADAPALTAPVTTTAPVTFRTPAVVPADVVAPVASVTAPIDYVARDREIARLKKEIDEMDEDMRMARINPAKYRYWYKFQWNGSRVDQTSYAAYMKNLDEQRNELRREKWRLEGP